jgi:hypothetical protein
MKRLVSYLLVSAALAVLYSAPAGAAGKRVSLNYEAGFILSIPAPGAYGATDPDILYLPAVTPARLLNDDYEIILRASGPWVTGHGGRAMAYQSGWKLVNADPRYIRLQPTYFWSGNEVGVRADVWKSDRFLLLTYKHRF